MPRPVAITWTFVMSLTISNTGHRYDGGHVSRASQVLGKTPLVTTLPAGGDTDIVLALEGFAPEILTVSLSTDVDRTAKLKRRGRAAPPRTATEGTRWGETEKPAFLKDPPR